MNKTKDAMAVTISGMGCFVVSALIGVLVAIPVGIVVFVVKWAAS